MLVSIVIPIHNEESVLSERIDELTHQLDRAAFSDKCEILLIENGSTDGTVKLAKKLMRRYKNIELIELGTTANYGKALKAGVLAAKGDIIINYDIDFYDVRFLQMALALLPFGYDIIVASKNNRLSKDERAVTRRIISGFFKYVLYYGFGLDVSDTHGIKAWRNDTRLRELIDQVKNDKEIFDTELIIRSQYSGRRLLELPITISETRKSVTAILPRAFRGFLQISKLWVTVKILRK